jgi:hypothetical protein
MYLGCCAGGCAGGLRPLFCCCGLNIACVGLGPGVFFPVFLLQYLATALGYGISQQQQQQLTRD